MRLRTKLRHIQAGLCQAGSGTTLLVFPRGGSNDVLFQHEFIQNAKPVETLQKMIVEAKEIQEEQTYNMNGNDSVSIEIHFPKTFVKIRRIELRQ